MPRLLRLSNNVRMPERLFDLFYDHPSVLYLATAGTLCGSMGGVFEYAKTKSRFDQQGERHPRLETPIRCVYEATKFSSYLITGGLIGGLTAVTFPVSLPLYVMYCDNLEDKKIYNETHNK
jgi:hypothetical protein